MSGVAVRRLGPGLDRLSAAGVGIYRTGPEWDEENRPNGDIGDFLTNVDIVLDCTPRGTGKTLDEKYAAAGVRVIYQGGEPDGLAETDYCYGIGFEEARSSRSVRIPSCNTTALVRLAKTLEGAGGIARMRAVMTRSTTDPDTAFKGTPNDLSVTPGQSHHGDDAKRFLPDLDIITIASGAPVNCGHLASIFLDMREDVTDRAVVEALSTAPRSIVLTGGTGSMHDLRRLCGSGPRNDCPSVLTWREAVTASGAEVSLFAGIHMESIVIPETLDAMQAMADTASSVGAAMTLSDRVLGLRHGEITHKGANP